MPNAEVPRVSREQEITRIMAQYGRSLKRMCYLYLKDAQAAEDAAQETFLKAYKSMNAFRGDCAEKTWLMRIAVNVCRDMLRTAWFRRVDRRVPLESVPEPPGAQAQDRALLDEIMRLPAKYKEVILLYYYQGMTAPEIAKALGQSLNTVKSRLRRGRDALKERLKGWYFDA